MVSKISLEFNKSLLKSNKFNKPLTIHKGNHFYKQRRAKTFKCKNVSDMDWIVKLFTTSLKFLIS